MHLKKLWDHLVAAAGDKHQVIASAYATHIDELSEDLGDLYEPKEYPKWVNGRIVESSEEEAALNAPAQEPAAPPPAPLNDGGVPIMPEVVDPPAPPEQPPVDAPATADSAAAAALDGAVTDGIASIAAPDPASDEAGTQGAAQ